MARQNASTCLVVSCEPPNRGRTSGEFLVTNSSAMGDKQSNAHTVWGAFRPQKRDNSQCSIALDYGYKRWSTNREPHRAYTRPEWISYLVGTVCCGRSNFVNFWTNIWPAEQPRATSDSPDRQFLTYPRARRSDFLEASFGFWETTPCPVKLYTSHDFSPVKLQHPTIFLKWFRQ